MVLAHQTDGQLVPPNGLQLTLSPAPLAGHVAHINTVAISNVTSDTLVMQVLAKCWNFISVLNLLI